MRNYFPNLRETSSYQTLFYPSLNIALIELIRLMTDEDKILKDMKKAVEEGRSLDRFGAYPKNFEETSMLKKDCYLTITN